MSLQDLHAPLYVIVGDKMSEAVRGGAKVSVPLWASFLTGSRAYGDELILDSKLYGWDTLGRKKTYQQMSQRIPYRPWMTGELDPLAVRMPNGSGLAILWTELKTPAGNVLHRNFTTFVVEGDAPRETQLANGEPVRIVRTDPADFSDAKWSQKQWNVLDGRKANGAGSGFFEYTIPWPTDVDSGDVEAATYIVEASSKQLFGKDSDKVVAIEGEWMRGEGTFDPSLNRNAYPMTDETLFPSAVTISINDTVADQVQLADDSADHRGILSWHNQLQDQYLREAGSYGQLVSVAIPPVALEAAEDTGELVIRLEVDEALPGGLAIYGKDFGRYPLDPTVVFALKP
ncbi:MAG: hypothetical protein ACR2KU_09195 [Gammaproteobacteria bacterium]